MDQSPAQPDTPYIFEESMTKYMVHLHMQHTIDGYWHNLTVTGVPVTLLAIDTSGNVIDIGTATSDMSGNYQMEWTPSTESLYKITATFAGSNSYGSSWAETGLSVGPAPVSPENTDSPVTSDAISANAFYTAIAAATIAIILAVAVVGLLLLRKRQS